MSTYINEIIRAGDRVESAFARSDPARSTAVVQAHTDLIRHAEAAGVDRDLINWALEIHGRRAPRATAPAT